MTYQLTELQAFVDWCLKRGISHIELPGGYKFSAQMGVLDIPSEPQVPVFDQTKEPEGSGAKGNEKLALASSE